MFVFNGYRWTIADLVLALVIAFGGIYLAAQTIIKEGVSLASVAGSMWGFGTLMFIFLYRLPILGQSVEAEWLEAKKVLTVHEVSVLFRTRDHSPMHRKTIKYFFVYFFLSGSVALIGMVTNT